MINHDVSIKGEEWAEIFKTVYFA